MVECDLALTTFISAVLRGADLTGAFLSRTVFAQCLDLGRANGLDAIRIRGVCSVDHHTLRNAGDQLPAALREAAGADATIPS